MLKSSMVLCSSTTLSFNQGEGIGDITNANDMFDPKDKEHFLTMAKDNEDKDIKTISNLIETDNEKQTTLFKNNVMFFSILVCIFLISKNLFSIQNSLKAKNTEIINQLSKNYDSNIKELDYTINFLRLRIDSQAPNASDEENVKILQANITKLEKKKNKIEGKLTFESLKKSVEKNLKISKYLMIVSLILSILSLQFQLIATDTQNALERVEKQKETHEERKKIMLFFLWCFLGIISCVINLIFAGYSFIVEHKVIFGFLNTLVLLFFYFCTSEIYGTFTFVTEKEKIFD